MSSSAVSTRPAATSSAAASSSTAHPRRKYVPQGKYATRAFGFLIDDECFLRWCKTFYDQVHGPEVLAQMSPEEVKHTLDGVRMTTSMALARPVYHGFPNIPRLRRNMVDYRSLYVFVLRNNSSYEAAHAPIDPEDLKGVQELLGVEGPARWYRVNVE